MFLLPRTTLDALYTIDVTFLLAFESLHDTPFVMILLYIYL
jgi:hypothetical protein